MKSCRNCKHAKWYRHPSGRKSYEHQAFCTYPIPLYDLPLSAKKAIDALHKPNEVASYVDGTIDCPCWESHKQT